MVRFIEFMIKVLLALFTDDQFRARVNSVSQLTLDLEIPTHTSVKKLNPYTVRTYACICYSITKSDQSGHITRNDLCLLNVVCRQSSHIYFQNIFLTF